MVRIPMIVALTLVVVATGASPVWAQTSMTRHQRIAASILRRKAASEMASAKGNAVKSLPARVPVQGAVGIAQEALPDGVIQPPSVSDTANAITAGPAPEASPSALQPVPLQPVATDASALRSEQPPVPDSMTVQPGVVGQEAVTYPAPAYSTSPPAYSTETYPDTSYPVTPHQPLAVPAEVNYQDPFGAPVDLPSIAPGGCVGGCDGGCDGGCASVPTCGLPGGCGVGGCVGCGGAYGGHGWITTFSLFGGVHGFKNGVNRGDSGSFGFQEGFNLGSPFNFSALGMQSQIGFRATQTDFNGSSFTADSRAQFFVTGGFFKRNFNGWQGGFVIDYLHDDWYTTVDIGQIRGELSYAVPNGSSVGFAFSTGLFEDDTTSVINGSSVNEEWNTLDYYTFFYEVQSNHHRRGQWRVWVGMTGESDGIIGSDFKIPLAGTWSLEPEFTYVVPDEATGAGGNEEEAWNVGVNLVWYPGRALGNLNYRRLPMFDVAGNGSLVTRRN